MPKPHPILPSYLLHVGLLYRHWFKHEARSSLYFYTWTAIGSLCISSQTSSVFQCLAMSFHEPYAKWRYKTKCDPILENRPFRHIGQKWLLQLNMIAILLWTMCENFRVIGPSVEDIWRFYYPIHYKLTFDYWSRCSAVYSPYTFLKQSKSTNRDKSPLQEVKDQER